MRSTSASIKIGSDGGSGSDGDSGYDNSNEIRDSCITGSFSALPQPKPQPTPASLLGARK